MNLPLSVKDMQHIVDLLREDLSFSQTVLESAEAMEATRGQAQQSHDRSRRVLQKIAHHTIEQAYEPERVAKRHHLN